MRLLDEIQLMLFETALGDLIEELREELLILSLKYIQRFLLKF